MVFNLEPDRDTEKPQKKGQSEMEETVLALRKARQNKHIHITVEQNAGQNNEGSR